MREDYLMTTYFNDMRESSVLSPEKEKELLVRAQDGDIQARNELVVSNSKFITKIAKKFMGMGLALEDLVAEGQLGLYEAIRKFDLSVDTKFLTYAVWWIEQYIRKAIQEQVRAIRLPANKCLELNRLNREIERFNNENIPLDLEEISNNLSMSVDDIKSLIRSSASAVSLDMEIDNDGSSTTTLCDLIPSNYANPVSKYEEKEEKEYLYDLINELPEREKKIICMRYGLGDYEEMSLQDVGEAMNLTKERVRQLEKKALTTMRERAIA